MGWAIDFPGSDLPTKALQRYLVTPGYLEALGMRIVRGRGFSHRDGRDALAAYLPARRASRVDPVIALRSE